MVCVVVVVCVVSVPADEASAPPRLGVVRVRRMEVSVVMRMSPRSAVKRIEGMVVDKEAAIFLLFAAKIWQRRGFGKDRGGKLQI